jgi:MFS family permease
MRNYPNIRGVIMLSLAFFFLFFAFNSASNIASKALKANGFENLGFYSLATLYVFFAIASLFSSSIVYRLQPKWSLVFASLCYSFWVFTLALTTLSPAEPDSQRPAILNHKFISAIIIIASALNGMGAAVLWVAQGKYLSDCTKIRSDRKGLYTSVFWTSMLAS